MRECEQQNLWAITNEQDHPLGGLVFLECTAGRGSKGHERSEKNVPGARFGARVRVACSSVLTVVSAVSRPLPRQGQAVQAIRGGTAKRLLGL